MAARRNSMRTAAAMVAAASAASAAQQAQLAQARDRAVAAAQAAQLNSLQNGQSERPQRLDTPGMGAGASQVARQRSGGSARPSPKVSSKDGVHIHIHQDGAPTLNPAGHSGAQPQPDGPHLVKGESQGTNGSRQIRRLTFEERAAQYGGPADMQQRLAHARQRVNHAFNIEIRPDGTLIHKYGNDVPANMREIVVGSARRHAKA